jgi:glyoxylase-like metal-dependent hydrolase (beta-lactamase superfamily II)
MEKEISMSDAPASPPPPIVDPAGLREIASEVWVIGDRRVPLVPNIGIVGGEQSVLVIDTGMGPANGRTVLDTAKRLAGGRNLILTITHFHPEHGFGAQVFRENADIFYNSAQRDELVEKGDAYLGMFRTFGPGVADALEGTEIVTPDRVYEGTKESLDLGGRTVELRTWGLAHTKGDQVVWLPKERILFTGDLAEERIFPIFPWFPPEDADLDATRWSAILAELEGLDPRIVVPGHGDIGGKEILVAVREYMADLSARVADMRRAGQDADAIVASLAPVIRDEHPDWDAPEWIDFAIRYYAAQS